ncbi:MAG TPA: Rnf-Nqr domain containing protein, partial [Dysgonamonadaceae bacterium]|nr:Rnf-Nqr domain containing protein [Dysgonamonadaceae bacterium]
MALLNSKTKAVFLGPLNKNNPVIIQVLGICSALAITSKLEPSVVMTIAVVVVAGFGNVIISMLRNTI